MLCNIEFSAHILDLIGVILAIGMKINVTQIWLEFQLVIKYVRFIFVTKSKFMRKSALIYMIWSIVMPLLAQYQPGLVRKENTGPWRHHQWLMMNNPTYEELSSQKIMELQARVAEMAPERSISRQGEGWEYMDLAGALTTQDSIKISGRIRALDYNQGKLRIGAASGGVWEVSYPAVSAPRPLGLFQITSANIGALATHPLNSDIILVGTGEANVSSGTGIWKSQDGGANWYRVNVPNSSDAYTKIVIAEDGVCYASGSGGLYKSTDSGENWTFLKAGFQWDVITDLKNSTLVYIASLGAGISKSTNGGANFSLLSSSVFPTGISRIALSMCAAVPTTIYSLWTKSNNQTAGLFRTEDAGTTWRSSILQSADGNPAANIHGDQGWYDNMITVSPVASKVAFCGGTSLLYSSLGSIFRGTTLAHHADIHCSAWTPDGKVAFIGTDGGVYLFRINGTTASSLPNYYYNSMPITQFTGVSVGKSDNSVMIGGSQDNGIMWRSGGNWVGFSGDGGPPRVDPTNASVLYGVQGYFGKELSFHPYAKNGNDNWRDVSSGLNALCEQWYTMVTTDYNNPATMYYHACQYVYASTDKGATYQVLNRSSPFNFEVGFLQVSKGEKPLVYCGIHNNDLTKLMVYDVANASWTNKTPYGKNNGRTWSKVFPSQVDEKVAYAAMTGNGNSTSSNKIFKTIDGGDNWTNITGNIPDVPILSVLENPYSPSQIYVGTDGFGVFRTLDGGRTYERWDRDLPYGVKVNTLDYVDDTPHGGNFYVVIGAYGHALMRREIPMSELVATQDPASVQTAKILSLQQIQDEIILSLRAKAGAKYNIELLNLNGDVAISEVLKSAHEGMNTVSMKVASISSGMYIVRLMENFQYLEARKIVID